VTLAEPPPPALAEAVRRLTRAGVPSPEHDARMLLEHARTDTRQPFDELVARRAGREPLQHITGRAGFRRLLLQVGSGVFVPRPETEVLVDWCVARLRGRPAPVVVDLCAGCGAAALSIAHEVADATVLAVEREPAAFRWLQRNAGERGRAGDRPITAVLADMRDALPELDGQVNLLVANPPYLADHERTAVEVEVREHDPATALWAGPDGLAAIRIVVEVATRLLAPGGWLAVEHGDRQGGVLSELLAASGTWTDVADHRDLAGRDRFTTARRNP
jgi:release factor glutamine methyltransferase